MATMAAKLSIAGLVVLGCLVTLNSAGVHRKFDEVPECPYGFVGNRTYPHNCVLYVECTEKTSTVKTCAPLKVFDDVNKECDWSEDHPECEDGGFINFDDFERSVHQV